MQFSNQGTHQDSANSIKRKPVARSTRSAFARGPLAGIANEVTPTAGAVPSPSSPTIEDASSHQGPESPSSLSTSSPSLKTARNRGVPHVYRDYTNEPDSSGYIRRKTGGVIQPFPDKLHEMLGNVREPDVVTWLPHGRAFIVRKPKEFTTRIMPRFFRQTKLTSFQRQLNLYGFRRVTQGPDAGAYYHELFLRGRPQLSLRMQRQKVKGTGHKQPADAMTEPNFYAMPASLYVEAQDDHHESKDSPIVSTATMQLTSQSNPDGFDDMSPGMRNLHGAANLLKNIAAGIPVSSMKGTPLTLRESTLFVPNLAKGSAQPPTANFATATYSSLPDSKPKARISFLSVGDGPMSLLGRVNMEHPTTSESQIWPPVKTQAQHVPVSIVKVLKDRPDGNRITAAQFQGPDDTNTHPQGSAYFTLPSLCQSDDSGPMEIKVSNDLNGNEPGEV